MFGDMTQVIQAPEFEPQYHQKKKKRERETKVKENIKLKSVCTISGKGIN
jgi:hypothetical protein